MVNSKTAPSPEAVEPTTIGIAGRSISRMIKQQTECDLLKFYLKTHNAGVDFNVASVPLDFNAESKEFFDKEYMAELYALGYELASKGYKWGKQPLGL